MKIRSNIALSESGFIFNPNTGESFNINPMGHQILELLRQEKDFEEIRSEVLDGYDVDRDIFEKDFEDFINLLENYQILESDEQA